MAFKWITRLFVISFVLFVNTRWRHILLLLLLSLAIYFLYHITLYFRFPLLNISYIVIYLR